MPTSFHHERLLQRRGFGVIIGVDEAGRGPLAGPVVAAAAVLDPDAGYQHRIDDSKKLTPLQRSASFFELLQKIHFGIGIVSQEDIDRMNIRQATKTAMERAVASVCVKLGLTPAGGGCTGGRSELCVLVDGTMPLDTGYPCVTLVGGDAKSKSIAAASIIAKVVRDAIMQLYHRHYPLYGFSRHKGYATAEHRRVLSRIGPSPIHRRSFLGAL